MIKQLRVSRFFLVLFFIFSITHAVANESEQNTANAASSTATTATGQEKVIYEYKKEDYFDFEALSVKGELLTPGDLSGKAVKRVKFNSKEYIRKDFDDFIEDDLMEIY